MSAKGMLQRLIDNGSVKTILRRGPESKQDVRALQALLHKLGFDNELNWNRYGADGYYGKCTAKGVKAFCKKNKLPENGDFVTEDVAREIIQHIDNPACH